MDAVVVLRGGPDFAFVVAPARLGRDHVAAEDGVDGLGHAPVDDDPVALDDLDHDVEGRRRLPLQDALLGPAPAGFLVAEGDGLDAPDAFDQQGVVGCGALELLLDPCTQWAGDEHCHGDVGRYSQHCDQEQFHRIEPHHDQEDDREDRVDQHGERRVREELANGFQLAYPHRDVAYTPRFEIGEIETQQMAKQLGAQLDVNLLAGFGIEACAQPAE